MFVKRFLKTKSGEINAGNEICDGSNCGNWLGGLSKTACGRATILLEEEVEKPKTFAHFYWL